MEEDEEREKESLPTINSHRISHVVKYTAVGFFVVVGAVDSKIAFPIDEI